ncbi:MAG: c-type cytochrome [Verrucomicrobia bacterium]|nr:c-type cytochrome [Verrucomicrobiota bacterium]
MRPSILFSILLILGVAQNQPPVAQTPPPPWQSLPVPGSLNPGQTRDGFGWYRTWIKPHSSFFLKHERNLFEESVVINIRDLAGAHELYVNGQKIGSGGRLPPAYESGRDGNHRHKVPAGTLKPNLWNEIALRVYSPSAPGGFLGEAPFIMNYFMECSLEGIWQYRSGDFKLQPSEPLAERPVPSAFDSFHESHRVLGEAEIFVTGPRMTPADSLKNLKPSDDLAVDQLLHEPQIAQPVHFSFDERGRLWVAEYRQYPYPAGLKMLSRDKYYRSHYDNVPPAPPNHTPGRDVISIHEDTNHDGRFDSHKTFLDGLNMANSALPGRGGVWVMHTPYLLFYPDADFDDHPDGPPQVRLEGFGFQDTHSVANGLTWGMDGWLYGAQGSTTSSRVKRPGIDPPDAPGVYFEGCMVWRYHPETHEYQIFAEGSGNTFGLEVDAEGRLFSGHNGGDTRGWHYIQGGMYVMQGVDPGKFGPPRNPYAFGDLPMMRTTTPVQRFSHIAAMVEGTAFPANYEGQFFALDPIHSVVIAAARRVRGASFETADIGPVLESEDPAFRPVYIANAPDGSLFVADMYEYYIAHGQHYQNQIDHTTGRIYRLRGRESALETDTNLAAKTENELADLLAHPNKWHRHTAVRLLGERGNQSIVPRLRSTVLAESSRTALGALWALEQLSGLDEATTLVALQHPYPSVRLWTVRLIADRWGTHPGLGLGGISPSAGSPAGNVVPEPLFQAVLEQAQRESSPEVRSQMAASARRLSFHQTLPLVAALLRHDEDLQDPYIPLLCWWSLEPHAWEQRDAIVDFLGNAQLWNRPIVLEHLLPRLMRRYAMDGRREGLLTCARLLRQAPEAGHVAQLMQGFEDAYRGRSISGLPDELLAAMNDAGHSPLVLRVRQGNAEAIGETLRILVDSKAGLEQRILLTRVLGQTRSKAALPTLLETVRTTTDPELRTAAITALSGYDEPHIGTEISGLIPGLSGSVRNAALALLASRAQWGDDLLRLANTGDIDPASLADDVVARLRSHNTSAAKAFIAKRQARPRAQNATGLRARTDAIQRKLAAGTGNPYAGETLFMDRCAGCHKLFFKGGRIGPDLTSYQRDNLGTLLTSIVDPNTEIREGYEYYLIETRDGRSVSGFVVERDTQITVLRGFEGEDILLRTEDIQKFQPMERSLMPEGLLDDLNDQELRDLFAYLRLSQPISR